MRTEDIAGRWERIKQLKRDGDTDGAIALLEKEAADQEAEHRREGFGVAPAAFQELQRLYRREGRPSDELTILNRLKTGSGGSDASVDALVEEATTRLRASEADPIAVACPHCGVVLDPPPKASRNCPDCREKLVIRTDSVMKTKLVLSADDAEQFDRDKKVERVKAKVVERLGRLGLGLDDYEVAAADLRFQFSVAEPAPGDVFWRLANSLALAQNVEGDWYGAARTQMEMARHVHDEGRTTQLPLEAMQRSLLRAHAENTADGSSSTAIPFLDIATPCDCGPCQKDEGRRIAVSDAQVEMPLPHTACETGLCRCGYRSVYPDSAYDSDGNLLAHRFNAGGPAGRPQRERRSMLRRLFGN